MNAQLLHGDCLQRLKELPDNSVDAVVTDPPYGLSFMGKKWDYDVPSEDIWRECLRVLKPGGHLLAFAGTRTQHRMAVRIEDAGFEIRDMIAWVYGSGFPKSLDVSKAIDKMDASAEQERRRLKFTAWVRSAGITAKQIDEATGTNMGGHYTTAASQPAIMTREHLEQCRHLLGEVPAWVEQEADIRSVESKNFAEREVVGQRTGVDTRIQRIACATAAQGIGVSTQRVFAITAPATEAAKQWQGWGTSLKPALEPVTVARKPFKGAVAANVLTHGTGAINVDGCRVGTEIIYQRQVQRIDGGAGIGAAAVGQKQAQSGMITTTVGRWPANLIHDGSDEVVRLFPVTGASKSTPRNNGEFKSVAKGRDLPHVTHGHDDAGGSAARFFYCAKASKRDRDEGLEHLNLEGPGRTCYDPQYHEGGGKLPPRTGNFHPTVKPTALMRYLCRLVTPPGGTVLDPFMGSGSTGKAAMLEGFQFIGIEREAEYLEIAKARIEHATKSVDPQLDMPGMV